MQAEGNRSISVGFFGLLTLLFIALKLMGHIDWSWWWVLAPLWGPLAFFAMLVLGAYLIALIYLIIRRK